MLELYLDDLLFPVCPACSKRPGCPRSTRVWRLQRLWAPQHSQRGETRPLAAQPLPQMLSDLRVSRLQSIRPRCLGTQVYLMPTTTGRVGLLPHASALVSGARLWQMSLPADGEQNATHADRPSSAI